MYYIIIIIILIYLFLIKGINLSDLKSLATAFTKKAKEVYTYLAKVFTKNAPKVAKAIERRPKISKTPPERIYFADFKVEIIGYGYLKKQNFYFDILKPISESYSGPSILDIRLLNYESKTNCLITLNSSLETTCINWSEDEIIEVTLISIKDKLNFLNKLIDINPKFNIEGFYPIINNYKKDLCFIIGNQTLQDIQKAVNNFSVSKTV